MNNKAQVPFVATHPGELIKDELKERKLTQKKLAEMTGINTYSGAYPPSLRRPKSSVTN